MSHVVTLDLREVSDTFRGHRRLINLVREFEEIESDLRYEVVCERLPPALGGIGKHCEWVPPVRRMRALHYPNLGWLRSLLWGPSRVMHFMTGDIWHAPTCATVVTLHDLGPIKFPQFFFTSPGEEKQHLDHLELVFRVADRIILPSEATLKDAAAHFPGSRAKFRKISPGLDRAFYPEDWGTGDRSLFQWNIGAERGYILYVGGHGGHKNLKFLLEAYAEYSRMVRNPRKLVLVGDKLCPHTGIPTLYETVQGSRLRDQIIMTGWVSDGLLRRLYCAAGLFVYPSLMEGFGYAPLEAMACGCPVLSSTAGALAETLGSAAALLSAGNPEEWGRHMANLLEDRRSRALMISRGLARVKQFSWRTAALEHAALYRELLENQAGTGR